MHYINIIDIYGDISVESFTAADERQMVLASSHIELLRTELIFRH
jgi:hypothetical protein